MIRAGYGRTPAEIGRRFTYRQIHAFFVEELAQARRGRRARLIDVNAAMAGGRAAEKVLGSLED